MLRHAAALGAHGRARGGGSYLILDVGIDVAATDDGYVRSAVCGRNAQDLVPLLIGQGADVDWDASADTALQRQCNHGRGLIAKAPSKDTAFVRTYPVRMNLTLSLDAKVVAEARRSAAAMGLSLNQAVRNYLVRLAGLRSPEEEIAEVKRLSEMAGGDRAGWTFDRDEIHRRA